MFSLLPKRPSTVIFVASPDKVIVADTVRDVSMFPITNSINAREEHVQDRFRLLGHFSTVTHVAVSNTFIATGDHDNKIRISCYQPLFVIQFYRLGHTDFITYLIWSRASHLLALNACTSPYLLTIRPQMRSTPSIFLNNTMRSVVDFSNGNVACMLH